MFDIRMFAAGAGIWLVATVALRIAGQYLLRPNSAALIVALFAVSFLLMFLLARGLCKRFDIPRDRWPSAAVSLALPTLILDALSSAFFRVAYPNIDEAAAGAFGGWMLCCCAGALAGSLFVRPARRA